MRVLPGHQASTARNTPFAGSPAGRLLRSLRNLGTRKAN